MLSVCHLFAPGVAADASQAEDGECVAVMRPSGGAGKTRLLRAIADLDPNLGEVVQTASAGRACPDLHVGAWSATCPPSPAGGPIPSARTFRIGTGVTPCSGRWACQRMCSSGRSCGFRRRAPAPFARPRPGARAALSYALELRLGRQLITAALRMTVQLLLVGLVVLMHQDISLML